MLKVKEVHLHEVVTFNSVKLVKDMGSTIL